MRQRESDLQRGTQASSASWSAETLVQIGAGPAAQFPGAVIFSLWDLIESIFCLEFLIFCKLSVFLDYKNEIV